MENIIIVLVLLAIVAGVIRYLVRAKKQGGCVGCPHAKGCPSNCTSQCSGGCKKDH